MPDSSSSPEQVNSTAEVQSSDVILRYMAVPADVRIAGINGVQGGRIFEYIDKAAYACATQWSHSYCVTAYLGSVNFNRAIPSGDMVEVRSQVVHTGRSSIHVVTEVRSHDPKHGEPTVAASSMAVFVAVDADKIPIPVEPYHPQGEREECLAAAAEARIPMRKEIDTAIKAQDFDLDGQEPSMTMRFLAKPSDVNWGGKVHGGISCAWADEAGMALTMHYTGKQTRLMYAGGVRFYRPVEIGHLVEVEAQLLRTSGTQMEVVARVKSGAPTGDITALPTAIHLSFTYEIVDSDGTPTGEPVPEYIPANEVSATWKDHIDEIEGIRQRVAQHPIAPE